MLRYALIIEDTGDNNVVQIGKTVTLLSYLEMKKKVTNRWFSLKQMHLTAKSQTNHLWLKH